MARKPSEMSELAARIKALEEDMKTLRQVLTPHQRLGAVVNQIRRQGRVRDERRIDRVVDRAVKRVRRADGTR